MVFGRRRCRARDAEMLDAVMSTNPKPAQTTIGTSLAIHRVRARARSAFSLRPGERPRIRRRRPPRLARSPGAKAAPDPARRVAGATGHADLDAFEAAVLDPGNRARVVPASSSVAQPLLVVRRCHSGASKRRTVMSHSWSVVVVPVVSLVLGCSHQSKPAANSASARVVAFPTSKAPPLPPSPSLASADLASPKAKEGDAIYFDFDSSILRDDARPVLQQVAEHVRSNDHSVRIEGNCDEVGTVEYNLALGEHRARAAREYLVHLGVASNKIATVTYGS